MCTDPVTENHVVFFTQGFLGPRWVVKPHYGPRWLPLLWVFGNHGISDVIVPAKVLQELVFCDLHRQIGDL